MKNKGLKQKLACRRGLGIEVAMLVLLVTTAMCILLVSTALLSKQNIISREEEVNERIVLDQIGDDFLTKKIMGTTPDGETYKDTGYKIVECTQNEDPKVLKVHSLTGELKLYVIIKNDKIIQWSYSNTEIGGQ